ncbi:hypothetical protein GK3015 [Geobacillus kaustophilus HTA426]|uniref:Uncharacterized protein n=1 Tax=Geobacillus kaustophilus (strain HTA426) TaxID=235909 RepID=Q5KVI6_GEOKA|nr:hypothetical protein GK3015 [Geobacillus kaustophilus HTA426]
MHSRIDDLGEIAVFHQPSRYWPKQRAFFLHTVGLKQAEGGKQDEPSPSGG